MFHRELKFGIKVQIITMVLQKRFAGTIKKRRKNFPPSSKK